MPCQCKQMITIENSKIEIMETDRSNIDSDSESSSDSSSSSSSNNSNANDSITIVVQVIMFVGISSVLCMFISMRAMPYRCSRSANQQFGVTQSAY